MTTSGTLTFDPEFAEIMDEAFEQCGIQPRDVTADHIRSALRSANLMLVEFSNAGVNQYQLVKHSLALETGEPTVDLPAGTIDAWSVVLRRDGSDTPVWPMGREAYEYIPNKTSEGRPFNYFVDRAKTGLTTRTITLWPVPENSTDTLEVWVWKFAEDATRIGQTLGIAKEWVDAYATNLAKRLSLKYAPNRHATLKSEAIDSFLLARSAGRERAPLRIRGTGYVRRGRR